MGLKMKCKRVRASGMWESKICAVDVKKNKFCYIVQVGLLFSLRLIHVWCRVCCRRCRRRRARRCPRSRDLCLLFRWGRELKRRFLSSLESRLSSVLRCKFIYTARTLRPSFCACFFNSQSLSFAQGRLRVLRARVLRQYNQALVLAAFLPSPHSLHPVIHYTFAKPFLTCSFVFFSISTYIPPLPSFSIYFISPTSYPQLWTTPTQLTRLTTLLTVLIST